MAAEIGPQDPPVTDPTRIDPFAEIARRLHGEPYSFRFFQAVRLLALIRPDAAQVGGPVSQRREVVRFGAHSTLEFPASEIQSIDWSEDPPRMIVNFMGLTGPQGVLPQVYTQKLEEQQRAKDHSPRDFFDIFNHRMVSLFYRAWAKYRVTESYEGTTDDRFSDCLEALCGLGTTGLLRRQSVEDESFLYFAGLLGLQARSAVGLEQILEDYFEVPVEVEQFFGAWRRLADDDTCCFRDTEELQETLGKGAVVGDEVWDAQARVRVRLGPLTLQQYRGFLPGNEDYRRLRDWLRFYARREFGFEVQLILRREDVPKIELGHENARDVMLGWTTWMRSKSWFPRDPNDAVLLLDEEEVDQ